MKIIILTSLLLAGCATVVTVDCVGVKDNEAEIGGVHEL